MRALSVGMAATVEAVFGEAGFLARVFDACARQGVVVDVVTTSEVSVSITANERTPLERVAAELASIGDVQLYDRRTILAVVGQHLPRRPGLGSEILRAVSATGVNVEMVSYAHGAINLTLVIRDEDVGKAASALHRVLEILGKQHGSVRGLVTMLHDNGEIHVEASDGIDAPSHAVRYRLGEGIIGRVVESSKPIVVPRVSREPSFLHRA